MTIYEEFKGDIINSFKTYCDLQNIPLNSELSLSKECAKILMKEYPYEVGYEGWRMYIYRKNVYILTPDGNDVALSTWDDNYIFDFIINFCA